MIDGLGGEEVNQSGLGTNLVQSVSGVFTRVDGTAIISAGSFFTAGSEGLTGTVSGVTFARGLAVEGP